MAGRSCRTYLREGRWDKVYNSLQPGDIVVAGANFGCGSSREHAPMALKAAGVACVVAASFARIFFRNAIDTALPILECPAAAEGIRAGDEVRIDLATGAIEDLTTGAAYQADPFPPFMREIVAAGGLAAWAATRARKPEEAE